jgi:hypothetical protein
VPATRAGHEGRPRGEALALAALVAGAAALRWVAWQRTAVVFDDGPRFLAIARAIDAGGWATALRDSFHPLYPALTAGAHRLFGLADTAPAWETAGALVSVAGGAAAVGFLFLFLRDAFGRGPAWCGALLLAAHGRAVAYASDVQSDGLYLGLFAAGLWMGWRAWRTGRAGWAAGAGAAAGLAYLTRPEGVGLALVLAGLGGLAVARRRWTVRAGAGWLAALGGAAALCMAPYVVALHEITGEWTLTHKKSVAALAAGEAGATPGAPAAPPEATASAAAPAPGPAPPPAPAAGAAVAAPPPSAPPPWLDDLGLSAPMAVAPEELTEEYLGQDGLRIALAQSPAERAFEALRMLVRHAKSALRYGIVVLVALGLLASRGRPTARGVYALASAALYLGVLFALAASAGYLSRRHALPPLLPLFGYAGIGALAAGAWLAQAAGAPQRRALAGALVLVGFVVGELTDSLAPKRRDQLAARRAAEWLREHAPAPGRLAASRQRLGYYAERPFVPLTGIADEALGRYLSRTGARYVLVEDPDRVAALRRTEGGAVRVLYEVEAAGEAGLGAGAHPGGGALSCCAASTRSPAPCCCSATCCWSGRPGSAPTRCASTPGSPRRSASRPSSRTSRRWWCCCRAGPGCCAAGASTRRGGSTRRSRRSPPSQRRARRWWCCWWPPASSCAATSSPAAWC